MHSTCSIDECSCRYAAGQSSHNIIESVYVISRNANRIGFCIVLLFKMNMIHFPWKSKFII